jgi:NAD(P)-dependent dehydrogenase (short-subunit alcohol dehydrogenase family)
VADRKTVIVTGASRGIGAAIALAFLDRDYNVLGTSRNCSEPSSRRHPGSASSMGTSGRNRQLRR